MQKCRQYIARMLILLCKFDSSAVKFDLFGGTVANIENRKLRCGTRQFTLQKYFGSLPKHCSIKSSKTKKH